MADDRDLTPILLIDRAGLGGFEFQYDGRPFEFKRGQITKTTYADVARFLFVGRKLMVWTTEGEFVFRLALRDAPGFEGVSQHLANELGPDVVDTGERIEIDTRRVEGWDLDGVDRSHSQVLRLNVPRNELRENQGREPGSRIVAAERG